MGILRANHSTEKKEDSPNGVVWRKKFQFEHNGGYVVTLVYEPSSWYYKVLHFLRIISPPGEMVVEYQTDPLDGQYAKFLNKTRNTISAVFMTLKGTGTVTVTVPEKNTSPYIITMVVERIPS